MIYEADCHTLKKDQVTNVKIDDYFLWKERSLFESTVVFQGSNRVSHQYGQDEANKIDTTISYEYVSSDVINDRRENKFPFVKTDGTYEIKTSQSFNPGGKYGKIQDLDLIRIKHNPCFECRFTAWTVLRKKTNNLIIKVTEEEKDSIPNKPNESFDQWEIVSGPDELFTTDEDSPPVYGYLINAGQRFTVSFSIIIHSGFIDPKTRNLGDVFSFTGWAIKSETTPNAKIQIGYLEYNASVGIEEGITAQIEWKPNKKRPA